MTIKDGIPVLKGFVIGGQICVWCPYCQAFHAHGTANEDLKKKSHRVAHCHDQVIRGKPDWESPFHKTGYYIQKFSEAELKKFGISK